MALNEIFDRVAAGVSAQGWLALPEFIDPETIAALREECRQLAATGRLRQAAVGNNAHRLIRTDIRGDEILWLDTTQHNEARQRCLARFEQLRLTLNRLLQLGLLEFDCHYARYAAGASYRKHLDRFRGDTRRILSSVLYLNDGWKHGDGGALRLYLDAAENAEHVDVQPSGGTLVVFLSESFPHEVLPARRERLSLTGWFLGRE
ncbi:MAG: 2OG-Fe(II) oxygenase [Prolixibacteraceae bacterium]|nr:2OG-Fe(II) oxygenase [Burkholderiales bacterium]